ncbi:hypothetical protein GCM10009131_29050 [Morganella psychrotolerans]
MRNILTVAGRGKLADPQHEKLSNKALGLAGASRDGTKIAISAECYRAAVSCAEKQDSGVAAALQLARCFGLRTEEAVQSVKSLKTWQQALLRGEARVRVVFGTKGGKPRDMTVTDQEKILHAVNHALTVAIAQSGRLVDRPDLKSAIDRYRNVARKPVVKADLFRKVNRADVALKGGTNRLSLTLTGKICKTRTHKKNRLARTSLFS